MHRPYSLAVWCALILLVAATMGARAQGDPQALLQQELATIAHGDVTGALALYRDSAVVDGVGLCAVAPCVGKVAIQQELEHQIARHMHATALNYYVSGAVVTLRYAIHSDATQQAGVDRIIAWAIVEIQQGKIATVRGPVWERTDEQTAQYLAWQRGQQAAR